MKTRQPRNKVIWADTQRFLLKTSKILSKRLDYIPTLKAVAKIAVPALADWCVVDVVSENNKVVNIVVEHKDPEKIKWYRRLRKKYPIDGDNNRSVIKVMRSGKSILHQQYTEEMLKKAAKDVNHLKLLNKVGYQSLMIVPVFVDRKIFGTVSFVSAESGRNYNRTDLQAAKDLAKRVGQQIEISQLHKEIRDTNEHLNIVLKGVADGITVQVRTGEIIFLNDAAAKLMGFRSAGQVSKISSDTINKRIEVVDQYGRVSSQNKLPGRIALKGKRTKPQIIRYRTKGKKEDKWAEVRAIPVFDEVGKVKFAINIFKDLTRQKQAEEFLKKSHQELRIRVTERTRELRRSNATLKNEIKERLEAQKSLAEEKRKMEMIYKTTKEGITLYDAECKVLYVNPYLKKLFGVKKEIMGQKRVEIAENRGKYFKYRMERSDDSLKTEELCLSGVPVTNVSIKVYSRPIRYLEGDYIPIMGRAKKVLGMVGSFRDVTLQRKQSEEIKQQLQEVERQRNRLEAVFDNVEEGVYVMDPGGKVVRANTACELLSGNTEREMMGRHYTEIFGCHDYQGGHYPDFDPISKVLATKETVPYDEHLHNDAEGRERWVGVSYTPILDTNRKVEQIISVIRDITSIKELEKAKSEFVSVASHELRTPLTVINGYLSLILGGDLGGMVENKDAYWAAMSKVYNETKRLTKLVEELLNVSRIEENRLRLTLRKISFVDMLENVVGEFRPIAQRKGIFLEFSNGPANSQKLYVIGDKYKLKQVLVNLLDNAVKFTPEGGKVKVECLKKDSRVLVNIEDTGAGISQQMIPHIFDKFQQVKSPYIKENEGTGLGLFIVRSLIEMHKGQVKVESKIGRGSRFSFNLPVLADN